jgi:PPK2 family polyphosphate:nucleotide phosphotransferase
MVVISDTENTMNAREQFRMPKVLQVRDADASRKPLAGPDKQQDKLRTEQIAQRIADLQNMFYAEHHRKLLVVLQGMDTAGKDGTIKGVFGKIDPLGIRSVAFKAPTVAEKDHDFLWRVHQQVPASGEIVIFNRSHYEDVLITHVHGWIDDEERERRCAHIRDFERMLAQTGTVIVKCFLHISKHEQKQRLQERLDDPEKHWKFDPTDLEERKHWDAYQRAYQHALSLTDADHAPWYVIPADSKTQRNLAIASILLETMEHMKLAFPAGKAELAKLKID